MNCEESFEILSSYSDGELSLEPSLTLEGHLAECPSCRELASAIRVLSHEIARLDGRDDPTPATMARIDAAELKFRRAGRSMMIAMVAAVVVLVVTLVAIAGHRASERSGLTDVLVADHHRFIPAVTPPSFSSGDPRAVESFFQGRTPFRPLVPELSEGTLLGARICNIGGVKAQLLFYEIDGSTISLYVSTGDPLSALRGCRSKNGTTICSGTKDGLSIHAVGSLPRESLQRVIDHVTTM